MELQVDLVKRSIEKRRVLFDISNPEIRGKSELVT